MSRMRRNPTLVRIALLALVVVGAGVGVGLLPGPQPAEAECHHWWCDPCKYDPVSVQCMAQAAYYCECCRCRHIMQ